MRYLFALAAFGLFFTLGAISYAQTPDDMTPAEESICDDLVGAAYGLCNAYCEAMDCGGEDTQASDEACDKVLDNYERKTDIPMPCLEPCGGQCGDDQICVANRCCDLLRCEVVDDCNQCSFLQRCFDFDGVLTCCVVACPSDN